MRHTYLLGGQDAVTNTLDFFDYSNIHVRGIGLGNGGNVSLVWRCGLHGTVKMRAHKKEASPGHCPAAYLHEILLTSKEFTEVLDRTVNDSATRPASDAGG